MDRSARNLPWSVCGCRNCGQVWDSSDAGGYSCAERITFLIDVKGFSASKACRRVSASEFPEICGLCNPDTCDRLDFVEEEDLEQQLSYRCGCELCQLAWDVNAGEYYQI